MPYDTLPPELTAAFDQLPEDEAAALASTWVYLAPLVDEPIEGVPSTEVAWRELEAHIDAPVARRSRRDRPPVRRSSAARVLAGLAFVLLLVTVGLLWWSQPVSVTSASGEMVEHQLPDGSLVTLAPATHVRYDRGFRSGPFRPVARSLVLDGEAFFEIVPGGRPFSIETHDATVTVLGTSFNVRARRGDDLSATIVSVESGSVRLLPHLHSSGFTLDAGQVGRASQTVANELRGFETIAVWRKGGFAIYQMPLADVLREIERRFDLTILAGEDLPRDTRLTLFYGRTVDARTVIHDVALAANLEYRSIRGGYEVNRAASPAR